jgi:hypothetical protein
MTREQINKTLREGTIKSKIILYFNDLALENFGHTDKFTPELLTAGEKNQIINEVTTKKDILYYNDLKITTRAFLIFRPKIDVYKNKILEYQSKLQILTTASRLYELHKNVLNEIIKDHPNKERVENIIKTVHIENNLTNTIINNHSVDFEQIKDIDYNFEVIVKRINDEFFILKELLTGLSLFIAKKYPLPFLKKYIKDEIKYSSLALNEISKTVENLKDKKEVKVLAWDEIEVDITLEDLENINNAGR